VTWGGGVGRVREAREPRFAGRRPSEHGRVAAARTGANSNGNQRPEAISSAIVNFSSVT